MTRRIVALLTAVLLVGAAGCGALPGDGNASSDGIPANESAFAHDGERLTVEAASNQKVSGHVNESLGAEAVTVRLQSNDASNPFLRSAEANVSEDGTFEVSVDFSQVNGGTEFSGTLRYNGTTLAETDGEVVNETA